jgi:hypothetical protein
MLDVQADEAFTANCIHRIARAQAVQRQVMPSKRKAATC